jgi:hypothetical protein
MLTINRLVSLKLLSAELDITGDPGTRSVFGWKGERSLCC